MALDAPIGADIHHVRRFAFIALACPAFLTFLAFLAFLAFFALIIGFIGARDVDDDFCGEGFRMVSGAMHAQFWQDRWATKQIGFHQGKPHDLLVKHHRVIADAARVYVPLCGKAKDLAWLRDQGHDVTGSELVASAVDDFFAEEGLTPTVLTRGAHRLHITPKLAIAQGDALALTPAVVGSFDAVYDRAALVAMSPDMRARYVDALVGLVGGARGERGGHGGRVLLISFAYDQTKLDGPPFSVDADLVHALFSPHGRVEQIDAQDEPIGPRFAAAGVTTLKELVFQIDLR